MRGNSSSFIKLLYLVSLTPRGRRLPLRIVNASKKIVFEEEEYLPFRFLATPKESQGQITSIEVEFPRNKRLLQGVPFYELNQAEVTVGIVREDHPTETLQFCRGTFVMDSRKMWITRLQQDFKAPKGKVLGVLRWVNQPPTKPGWYWLSDDQDPGGINEAAVVEVVKGKFGLEVHFSGTELTRPLKTVSGSWSGPIPQPENT